MQMNIFKQYTNINRGVNHGGICYIEKSAFGIQYSNIPGPKKKKIRKIQIGIYAGSGSSHSWLWFVDLFEKAGLWGLVFLDENRLKQEGLEKIDVLVISGGDTFAVAESLGEKGSSIIQSFVERGGLYIGSCAGAYLPMRSSKYPLNLFNFVDVKITNLSKTLPPGIKATSKFCTSYGCDYVYHFVREAVWIRCTDSMSVPKFLAPMYGGPVMVVSDPITALACYDAFADNTVFLVNKEIASKTMINHAAIVRMPFGKGCFYLLGPHLEHPNFRDANKWIIDAILWETGYACSCSNTENPEQDRDCIKLSVIEAEYFVRGLKRELSNSRIAVYGLEFSPVSWLIGKKIYEPDKIRVFLESMWRRIAFLEKLDELNMQNGVVELIIHTAEEITVLLRRIKTDNDLSLNTLGLASSVFHLLHQLSISFFEMYFHNINASTKPVT